MIFFVFVFLWLFAHSIKATSLPGPVVVSMFSLCTRELYQPLNTIFNQTVVSYNSLPPHIEAVSVCGYFLSVFDD